MDRQGISWDGTLLRTIDEDRESIRGGLGPNALAREVPSKQISNERSFADGVLANEHHLRFGIKFNVGKEGTLVEVVVSVPFLHGQHGLFVDAFEPRRNHLRAICDVVGARRGNIAEPRCRFVCPVCHGWMSWGRRNNDGMQAA